MNNKLFPTNNDVPVNNVDSASTDVLTNEANLENFKECITNNLSFNSAISNEQQESNFYYEEDDVNQEIFSNNGCQSKEIPDIVVPNNSSSLNGKASLVFFRKICFDIYSGKTYLETSNQVNNIDRKSIFKNCNQIYNDSRINYESYFKINSLNPDLSYTENLKLKENIEKKDDKSYYDQKITNYYSIPIPLKCNVCKNIIEKKCNYEIGIEELNQEFICKKCYERFYY